MSQRPSEPHAGSVARLGEEPADVRGGRGMAGDWAIAYSRSWSRLNHLEALLVTPAELAELALLPR